MRLGEAVVASAGSSSTPSVVLLGGGTGSPQLLVALRKTVPSAQLSIVVPVTDTGRSTGVVRRSLKIPGPGDLRHCLTTLAANHSDWSRLLEQRLSSDQNPDFDGMAVGNLMLGALTQELGDIGRAAQRLATMLEVDECVQPVSVEDLHLGATLKDGKRVSGELEVRRPGKAPIAQLHVEGATDGVWAPTRHTLASADIIIIGPGSLWTSLGGVLAVPGVQEAINSATRTLFVCNTTTQPGQTDEFDAARHVDTIGHFLGRQPDVVLLNQQRLGAIEEAELAAKGLNIVLPNQQMIKRMKSQGIDVISTDLLAEGQASEGLWQKLHTAYHDMDKVATQIAAVL